MSDFCQQFLECMDHAIVMVESSVLAILLVRQTQTGRSGEQVETMGHVWDGDLEEYRQPDATLVDGDVLADTAVRAEAIWSSIGTGYHLGLFNWTSKVGNTKPNAGPLIKNTKAFMTIPEDGDQGSGSRQKTAWQMGQRLFAPTACNVMSRCQGRQRVSEPDRPTGCTAVNPPNPRNHRQWTERRNAILRRHSVKTAYANVTYVLALSGIKHDEVRAQQTGNFPDRVCRLSRSRRQRQPGNRRPNLTDKTWLYSVSQHHPA